MRYKCLLDVLYDELIRADDDLSVAIKNGHLGSTYQARGRVRTMTRLVKQGCECKRDYRECCEDK